MSATNVPEITPLELLRAIEAQVPVRVIDVRAPSKVAAGRIDIVATDAFINIPGSTLLSTTSLEGMGLARGTQAVVVCGHGNDSKVVAAHINRLGVDARSLAGGMAAWMALSVPRSLEPPPSLRLFEQYDRVGKGALSYLLVSSGEAMIIDPPRDIRFHLDKIRAVNAKLVAVADTHVHADYISGAAQIAGEKRIPYYLHPSDVVYPYDGTPGRLDIHQVHDGMAIRFGECTLTVVHTPGHSPGSVTYLVDQRAALTGDFVFISSVGRPDLAARTEEWSAMLWKSIQRVLDQWPTDLMVYPGHYGSEAERREDRVIGATLGQIVQKNGSLRMSNEGAFISWVRENESNFPAAYRTIKAVNVGLVSVEVREADELEYGRNECALGGTSEHKGS